jgi:hypothetical protein
VNLTLSLLTGLVLLMPGMTAVAAWNVRGNRYGARRPDLPLTAVSALFAAVGISLIVHAIGFVVAELAIRVTEERHYPPLLAPPYRSLLDLGLTQSRPKTLSYGLLEFLVITLLESYAVARLIGSRGVDLVLHDVDARGQGWAFEHVIRPHMRGYTPIAFVLTGLTHDGLGIGYQGPVVDLRQTEDGGLRAIVLGQPQRFLYEIASAKASKRRFAGARRPPQLKIHTREWVGGVVALDAAVVGNIVVHSLSDAEVEARLDASGRGQ